MEGFTLGRGGEEYFKKMAAEETKWDKTISVSKILKTPVCTQERWICLGKVDVGPILEGLKCQDWPVGRQ